MKKKLLLVILLISFMYVFGQTLPDNWSGDSGIDTYQESSTVHGGSYSCRIDVNTGSQASCDFTNTSAISITAGDSYTVKFWYQTSAHVKGRIVLDWTGASSTYGGYTNAGSTGWEQFTASGTVPTGATAVNIRIRFYDQSGFSAPETQYIDDVEFESPTGTSLTVTNGDLESWPAGVSITKVYSISSTAVDVFYSSSITSVDPADYTLTGTATVTFSGASIDGGNDHLVHLTGASPSMVGDTTLDNLDDSANSTDYDFYAGILAISYLNTNNPSGHIDNDYYATFSALVSANDGYNNVWIHDGNGEYQGVMIYDSAFDETVSVGDNITIAATRSIFNSLTELKNPESISAIASTDYQPAAISGSDISETLSADTNPGEKWEGQLVKISNVYVESSGSYYYRCTDDGGTTYFYVGDNVDYHFNNISMTVGQTYASITGVVDWYNSGPYYRINPRTQSDIEEQPTAITLSEFTAEFSADQLSLYWSTQSEVNNQGWNVYRGEDENALQNDEVIQINDELIIGHGTTSEQHDYHFVDEHAVQPGLTYWYWLESIDNSGATNNFGAISLTIPNDNGENPNPPNTDDFAFLQQNYPNPVTGRTEINFSLAQEGLADLSVYNLKGQKIITLYHNNITADEVNRDKKVYWNGLDENGNKISSGIYLYTLKTKDNSVTRKMIVAK